jgi:hypothetical protein
MMHAAIIWSIQLKDEIANECPIARPGDVTLAEKKSGFHTVSLRDCPECCKVFDWPRGYGSFPIQEFSITAFAYLRLQNSGVALLIVRPCSNAIHWLAYLR